MHAKPVLTVLLLLVVSLLLTGSATAGQQKFTAPPPPSDGKALILVYRQRALMGVTTHATLFANSEFLADLHNADYAPYEVPEGTVTFTEPAGITQDSAGHSEVTLRGAGEVYYPPPDTLWPAGSACASLNWRRLPAARSEDALRCERDLRGWTAGNFPGFASQRIWADAEMREALAVLLGTTTITVDAQPIAGQDFTLLAEKNLELLRIEVKAGEIYYVEWSVPHFSMAAARAASAAGGMSKTVGTMKIVDAATGAKKISGLHLAEHR